MKDTVKSLTFLTTMMKSIPTQVDSDFMREFKRGFKTKSIRDIAVRGGIKIKGQENKILEKYDVGDCEHPYKPMFNRAVVPIYDNDHSEMIGCSGRTTCDQLPKWKHSKGLKTDSSLYNFWYAKDSIKKKMSAILVESPGNVWKLEMAGIHNSLAIYGSSLSVRQKILLDMTGAMTLYILTDNDEAGKKCRENIEKQCCKIYNIEHIYAKDNDVGEMNIEDIKELFKGKI